MLFRAGLPSHPGKPGQWLYRPTQRNHSGGAALVSHQTSQFVERSRPANNAKNASIIVEVLLRVKMLLLRGRKFSFAAGRTSEDDKEGLRFMRMAGRGMPWRGSRLDAA
jgi:hypothetical protein